MLERLGFQLEEQVRFDGFRVCQIATDCAVEFLEAGCRIDAGEVDGGELRVCDLDRHDALVDEIACGFVDGSHPAVEADAVEGLCVGVVCEEFAEDAERKLVESVFVGDGCPELGNGNVVQGAADWVVTDLFDVWPGGDRG